MKNWEYEYVDCPDTRCTNGQITSAIQEIVSSREKTIDCPICKGTGKLGKEAETVSKCNCKDCQESRRYKKIISKLPEADQEFMKGVYNKLVVIETDLEYLKYQYPCPECGGSGFEKQVKEMPGMGYGADCPICKGKKYIPATHMVKHLEEEISALHGRIKQLSGMVKV